MRVKSLQVMGLIAGITACGRPIVPATHPVAHLHAQAPAEVPLQTPPAKLASAAPPVVPTQPATIVLPWGAGPGHVARSQPQEANPEAPMAFRVGKDGALWILDQLNRRVTVIHVDADGKVLKVEADRPATLTTQDLLLTPDERGLWLLDRLVAKRATLLDARTGQKLAEAKLPEPSGGITGLLAFDGGLYVELAHEKLQRIAMLDGQPAEPDVLNGRPSADGKFAVRVLKTKTGVLVTAHVLRKDAPALWSWQQPYVPPPLRVAGLDVAADGTTRLTLDMAQQADGAAKGGPPQSYRVEVLGPDPRERRTLTAQAGGNAVPDAAEQFRATGFGADGRFYTAAVRENGFEVQRWAP